MNLMGRFLYYVALEREHAYTVRVQDPADEID